MALVRGTAVGEKVLRGHWVETGPGMHAGQGWRGPWELRVHFQAGMCPSREGPF